MADAFAAFFLLIAIIDPIGNMPMVISLRDKGAKMHPWRVCLFSFLIFVTFLVMGDLLMTIFQLQMDITQACTERCIHCYIPEYNPVFLPFEDICRVLDEFRDGKLGRVTLELPPAEAEPQPKEETDDAQ